MPRLSDSKITKGHAASFLIRLYLQEPEFCKELCQIRQNYVGLLAELILKQVEFFANYKRTFTSEEYREMVRDLYESIATHSTNPAIPADSVRQIEAIRQMYLELRPYFNGLEQLASRWKLTASWAGPMLYLYDIHDCLKELGMPDTIDVPLEQLDLLYPWPPPIAPLEIKVSAWAFVFYSRKQIQLEVAKKLKDYEGRLKAVGLKENPSALENHAQWWFEHYVKGKTYRELAQQFPRTQEETIKRKVWEFSRLVGIRSG
jgi:hypothetical protein